jgi:DNA-binding XRE family transcriptional regulator
MNGFEVRELRRNAGMSQTEFAEAIGVSRETISRIERSTEEIDRRTELAMRYIADNKIVGIKSVGELHAEITVILEEATFRGKVSGDRVARLNVIGFEWRNAGGGVTGGALLQSVQGIIGMVNTLGPNDALRDATYAELRQVKLAWLSLTAV